MLDLWPFQAIMNDINDIVNDIMNNIMNDKKESQYCERQTTLLVSQTAYLLVKATKIEQCHNYALYFILFLGGHLLFRARTSCSLIDQKREVTLYFIPKIFIP